MDKKRYTLRDLEWRFSEIAYEDTVVVGLTARGLDCQYQIFQFNKMVILLCKRDGDNATTVLNGTPSTVTTSQFDAQRHHWARLLSHLDEVKEVSRG